MGDERGWLEGGMLIEVSSSLENPEGVKGREAGF